jgi:hypothetical protein
MKRILLSLALVAAHPAFGATQVGVVTGYAPGIVSGKEAFVFKLENNSNAGCNTTARYTIDETSVHFKATVAAIMAAFHARTPVLVTYAATCNVLGGAADVTYVCVGEINC